MHSFTYSHPFQRAIEARRFARHSAGRLALGALLLCACPAGPSADDSTTDDLTSTSDAGIPDLPTSTCETLEVAMTSACVVGYDIGSTDAATAVCQAEFGDEWRWLDFHASQGGIVNAQVKLDAWDTSTRAWVWINDQDAECFSSPTRERIEGMPEQFGMTWKPLAPDAPDCLVASCFDATGLEDPQFDPHITLDESNRFEEPISVPSCNPYAGDTPCSLCRPLLCVRDIG